MGLGREIEWAPTILGDPRIFGKTQTNVAQVDGNVPPSDFHSLPPSLPPQQQPQEPFQSPQLLTSRAYLSKEPKAFNCWVKRMTPSVPPAKQPRVPNWNPTQGDPRQAVETPSRTFFGPLRPSGKHPWNLPSASVPSARGAKSWPSHSNRSREGQKSSAGDLGGPFVDIIYMVVIHPTTEAINCPNAAVPILQNRATAAWHRHGIHGHEGSPCYTLHSHWLVLFGLGLLGACFLSGQKLLAAGGCGCFHGRMPSRMHISSKC